MKKISLILIFLISIFSFGNAFGSIGENKKVENAVTEFLLGNKYEKYIKNYIYKNNYGYKNEEGFHMGMLLMAIKRNNSELFLGTKNTGFLAQEYIPITEREIFTVEVLEYLNNRILREKIFPKHLQNFEDELQKNGIEIKEIKFTGPKTFSVKYFDENKNEVEKEFIFLSNRELLKKDASYCDPNYEGNIYSEESFIEIIELIGKELEIEIDSKKYTISYKVPKNMENNLELEKSENIFTENWKGGLNEIFDSLILEFNFTAEDQEFIGNKNVTRTITAGTIYLSKSNLNEQEKFLIGVNIIDPTLSKEKIGNNSLIYSSHFSQDGQFCKYEILDLYMQSERNIYSIMQTVKVK